MYAYLVSCELKDKRALVVGCGFGDDALRLAKLGAKVNAFDLSPGHLEIARALASRERLEIPFDEMPAERMAYADNTFDYILARDILHHVDIPKTMQEIVRVAKPGAVFVVNEIYSHTIADKIRHSTLVEKVLYPKLQRIIYGTDSPYITEDERKLNERDLAQIMMSIERPLFTKYFNLYVTRVIPDRFEKLAIADRLLLRVLHPIAHFLAGRVLFSARIVKATRRDG
jgi:ubiquinone/menaquinone biosynthesis C-methylase UbiE